MQHTAPASIRRRRGTQHWSAGLGPLGLTAALWMAACAPSEEEIQREFDAYVENAQTCSAASECARAEAGCPLQCFVAVRADRVTSVERKAQTLIEDYSSGGESCIYSCVSPGELECINERCAFATP